MFLSKNHDLVPSYNNSHDQLQLGWAQTAVMITVHFSHPWADWQLYTQRHGAGSDTEVISSRKKNFGK